MLELKRLRQAKGLTQQKLAKYLGVSRSTIAMWETAGSQPDNESLQRLADFFNTTTDHILGRDDSTHYKDKTSVLHVPVLGHVAAGIPIEAIEDIIDYEELPAASYQDGVYFGLRIKGDSMEPRIKEGDVVIVRRQPDVESGEVAVVIVNGHEATVKRIVKHDNGLTLISFNSAYPPKFFTCNEVINLPVEIIGKVVELRGKF